MCPEERAARPQISRRTTVPLGILSNAYLHVIAVSSTPVGQSDEGQLNEINSKLGEKLDVGIRDL